MLINNTIQTLEFLEDVSQIKFIKTSETTHSTHILVSLFKNAEPLECELIVWSNPKKISSDYLYTNVMKDKVIIDNNSIKIIDSNSKTLHLEYFLNIYDDITLHLKIQPLLFNIT